MRSLWLFCLILACASTPEDAPHPAVPFSSPRSAQSPVPGARAAPAASIPTSAPASAPLRTQASMPASAPAAAPVLPAVVLARLVDSGRPILACGVIAFVGVYTYEIITVESGGPLSGKIIADLLCPDFVVSRVSFTVGAVHRLSLGPAKRSYAGTIPPASPLPGAPRFEIKEIHDTAPPLPKSGKKMSP